MSKEEADTPSGGSNNLFTVAVVAPVAVALVIPLWYGFIMNESQKQTMMDVLVERGFPAECIGSSLPTSACVNKSFPVIIITMVLAMIGYTVKTFFVDKPSQDILDVIESEFEKRHDVLKGLIQELELGFVHDEEDEDVEIFNTNVVWEKVRQLLELPNYDKEVSDQAFRWLWIVLEKDLRVTLRLTKKGEDVKFSDGAKLETILRLYRQIVSRAHSQGYSLNGEIKDKVHMLRWEATYYIRIHGFKTVLKACKMAMLAKAAFPFLVLQTIGTTFTATLAPLKLHYRAQVLENLRDPEGIAFWDAAKAMVFVELLCVAIGLMTDMIKVQAETLATKEIQIAYYDALLKMPVTFWVVQATQGWEERVDFCTIYWFDREVTAFLEIPQKALQDLVTALTYAYMILNSSSKSLVLLLAVNFGSSILAWVLGKINERLRTMSENGVVKESHNDFMSLIYSLEPDYISTYLSFVRGPAEVKRFSKMKTSGAELDKRRNLVKVFTKPIDAALAQGSQVAQFSTARTNVVQNGMGIADADTMVRSAESFVAQTQEISYIFEDVICKAKPLAKAFDIISIPRTIDADKGLWPAGRTKGHIEFKDVRFKYPRREVDVLKGVSFTVKPGDTIGMTGSAGCGKSTCMRLLERFYDVTGGSILLDGVDIREYNPRWLRTQIATVAQEPKLVPLTIRENLTFGCTKEPSLEEIYDALKAANIYDSIMDTTKFPQGLRTEMESAGNISGGEKQRIAIARAILADPPILLLDEATSALDEENQAKVQDALDKLMKGRTTLVIAHRLSTIKDSSKIVAFDKGTVFEEGKHEDLLQTDGSLYRKLWERQLSGRGRDDEEDEVEDGKEAKVEKEDEPIEPLPVEAGMNPKPTALKRLEMLIQAGTDPSIKEVQKVFDMLKAEEESREIRHREIQRSTVKKWQHHMEDTANLTAGKKNLKRLANKVIFNKLHSSVSEKLASIDSKAE